MCAKHKNQGTENLDQEDTNTEDTEGIQKGYRKTYEAGAKLYYEIIYWKQFSYKLDKVLENKVCAS